MQILSPFPPPNPAVDRLAGAPPFSSLQRLSDRRSLALPGARDGSAAGIVHVAVGRSLDKTLRLLQWTFRRFGCEEVGLLHVHQPSPTIPTLLGKLPANKANEELVSAYRREEKKEIEKILLDYKNICYRAQEHIAKIKQETPYFQVQAKVIMIETGHIHKGIVDLVTRHGIQRLVMGVTQDNCFKVKGSSSKVTYIARNAPSYCEIWFINKSKHLWTREASEGICSFIPEFSQDETALREEVGLCLSYHCNSEPMLDPEYLRFSSFPAYEMPGSRNMDPSENGIAEVVMSTTHSSVTQGTNQTDSPSPSCSDSTASELTLASEQRLLGISSEEELEIGGLCNRLQEVMMEVETSRGESLAELAKCKDLDSESGEAVNRMKASEAAYARENKLREDVKDLLQATQLLREELVYEKNEAMTELQNAIKTISILNCQAQEVAHRRDEAATELELIHSSIVTLRLEQQKIQQPRKGLAQQFGRHRHRSCARSSNCNKFFGFGNDSFSFTDFSLSDLQTATCGFSESFKLGEGGYGCVYKGELLNKTVVIKRFHPHNIQGLKEFQQEAFVLSKLGHPHLVTLMGACPEALSLVYEYLPNGFLHTRLFSRTTTAPLTWKVRTRIAAEISSALVFLHSSKPEKFIHGDLKPGSIFLDSDFSCKIGDFGICHTMPEDLRNYPVFHHWNTEPNGAFPYTDPEYQRTGILTPKSDVFSFGIIILQLLTGKPPLGLASQVRQAVLAGRLLTILDTTAGEWPGDVAMRLAEFGLQCSEMNSRDRPELTPEVVRELGQLHLMEDRPVPPFFLCPILQEIMHDPQVAADGFTYEGSALREWFANGRETSPMTNLKLDHPNLTPNHALRFAIQDWLCQPCRS